MRLLGPASLSSLQINRVTRNNPWTDERLHAGPLLVVARGAEHRRHPSYSGVFFARCEDLADSSTSSSVIRIFFAHMHSPKLQIAC